MMDFKAPVAEPLAESSSSSFLPVEPTPHFVKAADEVERILESLPAAKPTTPSKSSAPPESGSDHQTYMQDPVWQREFFMRRRLERARIPLKFIGKTLGNFKTEGNQHLQDLADFAHKYVSTFPYVENADEPKGLLMVGCPGCGKTHIAVAILRGIIERGYSGLYYNAPALMADIRATFDPSSTISEEDLIEEIRDTDLLVFDDLGAEHTSDFVRDRFYLIINKRYESCKPIILSSNLDFDTLESRLGLRIISRLYEMCINISAHFPDRDWRRVQMNKGL